MIPVLPKNLTDKHNFASVDQNVKEPFRKKCQASGGIGLRQNAIDSPAIDTHITNNDIVNDHTKRAVNQDSMVDRRQSTVECIDYSVEPVEDNTSVDGNSFGACNTRQLTAIPSSNHHINKQNTLGIAAYMVDCEKKTVEDDASHMNRNGNVNATEIGGIQFPNHDHITKNKLLGIAGSAVDRKKETVEDDTLDMNSSAEIKTVSTENSGTQFPHHHVTKNKSPGVTGFVVDRKKKTVEDDTTLDVKTDAAVETCTKSLRHVNLADHTAELENKIQEGCNLVNQRTTAHSSPLEHREQWKIQLRFNFECSRDIIQYLPEGKLFFEWNKSVVFGRGEGADIFINDDRASREHMELMGQNAFLGRQVPFSIQNMSRKGYNLNGRVITDTGQWIPLKKGDQIRIAGLIFAVDIIPGNLAMEHFVVEFKLPDFQQNPGMKNITSPLCKAAPFSQIGHPSFYYHVPSFHPCAIPYGNLMASLPIHAQPLRVPPTNGMHVPPHWFCGEVPLGEVYQKGSLSNITDVMVEQALKPYQGREGYVKIETLPYLALEIVGEWEELGRALGLKDWQLTIINVEYQNNIVKKSYQMLKTWVCSNPEQATLEKLKKALEDVTVLRGDLALKYWIADANDANSRQ